MRSISAVFPILCLALALVGGGVPARAQERQTAAAGSPGLCGASSAVHVHGSRAYVAFGADIAVLDASTPSRPTLLGEVHLASKAIALATSEDGRHLFVAHAAEYDYSEQRYRGGGMSVVDVSAALPRVIGSYDAEGDMRDLVAGGGLAYLAYGYEGVHIVDVTDPTNPRRIGFCEEGCADAHLTRLTLNDDLLFGAFDSGYGGLTVISVADPTRPKRLDFLHPWGLAFGLATQGQHLYTGGSLLRVLSVSGAGALSDIGSVLLRDSYVFDGDIAVEPGYAYVVTFPGGLHVVSTHDPAKPQVLGALNLPASTRVAQAGDILYATSDLGLHIVSVADRRNPTAVGTFSSCSWLYIPLASS